MKKNKKKGFTLIELVLVIAILGILSSLAVPKFLDYREEVKYNKFLSDYRALERAAYFAFEEGRLERGDSAVVIAKELAKSVGLSYKPIGSRHGIAGLESPYGKDARISNGAGNNGAYLKIDSIHEDDANKIAKSLGYDPPTKYEDNPRNEYIYFNGKQGKVGHLEILLY